VREDAADQSAAEQPVSEDDQIVQPEGIDLEAESLLDTSPGQNNGYSSPVRLPVSSLDELDCEFCSLDGRLAEHVCHGLNAECTLVIDNSWH